MACQTASHSYITNFLTDELISNRTKNHHNLNCHAVSDAGGMMTLTDAYVRINRARGLELISPEDLLDACQSLDSFENSSLSTCSSHVFTNSELHVLRGTLFWDKIF